jgi:hypothetical protein
VLRCCWMLRSVKRILSVLVRVTTSGCLGSVCSSYEVRARYQVIVCPVVS